MAENIHKNDHSAGLYRAMALRFYSRYVEMRESAHHRGGDLTGHGRLDTEREADQRYLAAVEEWLWETPDFLTKVTWDNYALVSPETAQTLGLENDTYISVNVAGKSLEIPCYTMPGQARYSRIATSSSRSHFA